MAIFFVMFEAMFQRRFLYQLETNAPESRVQEGTLYLFFNSCPHWRKFTLLFGTAIIQKAITSLMSEARRNVLIIDDSTLSRNRSKLNTVSSIINQLIRLFKRYATENGNDR